MFGSYKDHAKFEVAKNMYFVFPPLITYNNITPEKILELTQDERIDYLVFRTGFDPVELYFMQYAYRGNEFTVYATKDVLSTALYSQLLDIPLEDIRPKIDLTPNSGKTPVPPTFHNKALNSRALDKL